MKEPGFFWRFSALIVGTIANFWSPPDIRPYVSFFLVGWGLHGVVWSVQWELLMKRIRRDRPR